MDRQSDELIRRMLVAASRLAEERAADVISSAAAEAEAEVRALVKAAVKAALLQRVAHQLERPEKPAPSPPPPSLAPTTDAPPTSDAIGCYVYCITRTNVTLPSAPPVDPAFALRFVPHNDLAAVASDVPLEDFHRSVDPDRDLQWLGEKVTAHNQIIEEVAAAAPVIPLQFATILRSDQDLVALLDRHHEELRRTLTNLEGQAEWGVKIRLAHAANAGETDAQSDDEPATGRGTAYMTRKHKARIGRERTRQSLHRLAQASHERLAKCATDTRVLQLPASHTARLENGNSELLLNGAYLIRDVDRSRFQTVLDEISAESQQQGLIVQQTGPWPPYNFVNLNFIATESSR